MRIYDWHIAPNPRRLHIYLAEKGITVELVEVGQEDLTLAPWYKGKYPHAMVPMLELDDGTRIGEAMAIARYFEETQPEPPLMGRDAKEKAIVDMWEKRANEEGMLPASELFRNTHPAFADRGLPGSAEPIPQIDRGSRGSSASSTRSSPRASSWPGRAGRLRMQRRCARWTSRSGRRWGFRPSAGTLAAGTRR